MKLDKLGGNMKTVLRFTIIILFLFIILAQSGCQFNKERYTITFNSNGGSEVAFISAAYDTEFIKPSEPTKEGHQFLGWYRDSEFTQYYVLEKMPNENITLYAKWVINHYTVEFLDFDHTVLKEMEVTHGENAIAPNDPSRSGFVFSGWDQSLIGITSPLKIYAKYGPDVLKEAIDAFKLIFLDGDSLLGVSGDFIRYDESYNEQINYYCVSEDTTSLTFNLTEQIGVITRRVEDKTVKINCYAHMTLEDESYHELVKDFYLTILKDPNFEVDKATLKVEIDQSMQDAVDTLNRYYYDDSYQFNLLPSKGDVNILVVPIQFTNDHFSSNELAMIEYGFFGDGLQFETLQSYYLESSYGQLNINGDVLTPYTAEYTSEYYENYSSQHNEYASGVDLLIEELIRYYLQTNPNLDLSQFDSEGDGFIDAVHLVYSAPFNYNLEDPFYWAYQYYYYATQGEEETDYVSWGEFELDSYVFSSVDFFYENGRENAWTIIHETGHLLGLEDYYDYTPSTDSNKGGLGQIDIMDNTLGDHNPFSKLLLDWIDPIVVTDSYTLAINRFDTTGDSIIVANQFSSIFDEYFIMNFYTPSGLNGTNDFISESGLLMYHVNAKLPINYDNLADYSYYLEYNNSDSPYKLIKIEEADGDNRISRFATSAQNSDLLQEGDSYILKMYNNTFLCEVTVLDISEETITISFNFEP